MRKEQVALVGLAAATGWLIGATRRREEPPLLPTDSLTSGRRRVVILGGGWGGVYTALTLEKLLRPGEGVEVVLVNRENFFLFTPMLPEVTGSSVEVSHIVNPIRHMLHRTRFVAGAVEEINLAEQQIGVRLAGGSVHQFGYDQLVLALGGETNYYGLPGIQEHAFTVKSLADAIAVRNHIIDVLEQADVEVAEARRPLVTFVLAGGGLNGVEVMGAINDFVREAVAVYPHIPSGDIRTVLLEAGPRLMFEMDPALADFTRHKLEERGVEVWLNSKVASASDGAVQLADGRTLATRTLIWSAGVRPSPLLANLALDRDRSGRIMVDRTMSVPGHAAVWALGDCAHVPDPSAGKDMAYPPTAQHALRAAYQLGRNIAAVLREEEPQPFDYPRRIQLATIGHRVGVASLMGIRLSGILPWWLWRTYYLGRLPRLERRLRVTLDWTLDLFFPRDIVQLPVWGRRAELGGPPVGAQPSAGAHTTSFRPR
ncbi:MAG: NAD(P)/FAD-dependent oxidoreductase [Chloroflexota bacterium]